AREYDEDRADAADHQGDRRGDRVRLHQLLCRSVQLQSRHIAGAEQPRSQLVTRRGPVQNGSHQRTSALADVSPGIVPSSSVTNTLPSIMWWPTPQNSLQITPNSPASVGTIFRP